ncbi:ABC transporter substrate-binding protein [Colwellia piezophila]|uniref:ABC transporter substrate-binding protein n=1 Tax=Colwellia piezophila TaxID=211668 RepID=UPI00039E0637|nr:ABC transporter substrate binding protein [Colwellia piezophila]
MRLIFNCSITIILLLCSAYTFGQIAENKPTILVIHSWHDILWDRLWGKALHDKLSNKYQLVRYDLDAMRITPEQLKINSNKAWDLFQSLEPSLVILGDDAALDQMGLRFANKLPVVYLGINNNPRSLIGTVIPSNITGVIERPLYERALRHIVKLLPVDADRVLFLNDVEQNGASVTNISSIFKGNTTTKVGNVIIELKIISQWEKWQQTVIDAKSSGYDAIIFDSRYLLFDKNGTYVEPEAGVVKWMAKNSELPMFSFYEDSIGPQLSAGGWVLSGYGIGLAAADIVKDILENGKKPIEIYPVNYQKGEYIFSRTQLKRWGIILPENIHNQATFAEDLHELYRFDCKNYPNSICFN